MKYFQRTKKNKTTFENILVFIAIALSSFVGAQFLGISLNKVAIIPLLIYLIFISRQKITLNHTQIILLIFYGFSILSVFAGFFVQGEYEGLNRKLILYLVQVCVMYIPLVLLSGRLREPIPTLKKAIIIFAKVNAVWAIVQFLCWYGLKIDINDLIFNGLLKGTFGSVWTIWNYEAGSLALRASGFQSDAAFFAILLVLGFCLDKSIIWKCVYLFACVLSMSRTGLFVILIILFIQLVRNLIEKKITVKKFAVEVFIFAAVIGAAMAAYVAIPSVTYQVNYMLVRLQNIGSGTEVGTSRHMMYIPTAIKIWALDYNIVRKLIGIGPRCGGIALSMSNYLEEVAQGTAWALECDYAELLLAQGIFGYIIYAVVFKLFKRYKYDSQIRDCLIAIVIAGVMYNVLETTLLQIFLIILLPDHRKEKRAV